MPRRTAHVLPTTQNFLEITLTDKEVIPAVEEAPFPDISDEISETEVVYEKYI